MVFGMTGVSVRFETREMGGGEVLVLRYRLRRFVVVKFFTETYDPCTGEVCSAMDNMMGFVYRLMRFASEHSECFCDKGDSGDLVGVYCPKCLVKGCSTVTMEVEDI